MSETGPQAVAWYPVGLNLAGRQVLIIGGGEVAARRVRRLVETGAVIRVIAPEAAEELRALAAEGTVVWEERAAVTTDVEGCVLVIVATSSDTVNREMADAARGAGALVNRADWAVEGDVAVPMTVRVGEMTVAVHGGGTSPAFTRWVAAKIEAALGPEVEEFGRMVAGARARVMEIAGLSQAERADRMRRILDGEVFDLLVREGRPAAEKRIGELLEE